MGTGYDSYVFDLYGTLADIRTDENAPGFWRTLARYLSFQGAPCRAESLRAEYGRLCGEAQEAADRKLERAGLTGPAEIDLPAVWKQYFTARGTRMTQKELESFACLFRALSLKKLRLFPGALWLLDRLRAEGKKVYLLTNAQGAFTRPELRYLGLDGRFDAVFISSEAGVKKPSPSFFALLEGEGVRMNRALMIGNDDECDCRAAARAGMDSLYIRTAQSPAPSGPLPANCREIAELREVEAFI